MEKIHLITFIIYLMAVMSVIFVTYRKQKSESDFVIGGRSLNFWLTALSAHASDMSSWLFLAYPAMIYTTGLFGAWAAIGLTLFMFLNWHYVAPKIRTITEQSNSLTLNAYFENRVADTTGLIRLISSVLTLVFFTFYISSGLVAFGMLVESLFHLNYTIGISLGLLLVLIYVFIGGYSTVAWIDLFQGFFLLGVILFIPIFLLYQIGSFEPIMNSIKAQGLSSSFFPDYSFKTCLEILTITLGWGLGYFGQPHIITKFMGIRRVEEMSKSKYLGTSWQIVVLTSATIIGLIGIYMFPESLEHPENLIISIANKALHTFLIGLVLCAIIAATTNVMAAQILVVASSLSEDIYKRWIHKKATSKHLLFSSRCCLILTALISYTIAYFQISTIYKLVLFSWSGLGASFGPLLLISLYSKKINKYGAMMGIFTGGIVVILWPYIGTNFGILSDFAIIPGFFFSTISIFAVSYLTSLQKKV